MNETITGLTILAGIISMLLALYHTKSNRTRAKKLLFSAIFFYSISFISVFTDNKEKELLDHLKKGGTLLCKEKKVSLQQGWEIKKKSYLVKGKEIIYIKSCTKND